MEYQQEISYEYKNISPANTNMMIKVPLVVKVNIEEAALPLRSGPLEMGHMDDRTGWIISQRWMKSE